MWTIRTEASPAVIARYQLFLAPDERSRAGKFRFDHLRHSFILSRGALRVLLGCYLDISPGSVQFIYSDKGKPFLDTLGGLAFNASNSGTLAVFAFTNGCDIGVDVEQIRPLEDMQNIADRFFCQEEATELMSLAVNERQRAFFLCWTRKEAYIKAIGDGLSAPLDSFRVTLRPDQPARFLHIGQNTSSAADWTLHDLQLESNYASAIAYRDAIRPLSILPVINPSELLSIP